MLFFLMELWIKKKKKKGGQDSNKTSIMLSHEKMEHEAFCINYWRAYFTVGSLIRCTLISVNCNKMGLRVIRWDRQHLIQFHTFIDIAFQVVSYQLVPVKVKVIQGRDKSKFCIISKCPTCLTNKRTHAARSMESPNMLCDKSERATHGYPSSTISLISCQGVFRQINIFLPIYGTFC
jgi:hypothetical protein